METHVKERLAGAAILVGLIVILVPEMLSGPRGNGFDAEGEGDATLRTYTIDLTAPGELPKVVEPAETTLPDPDPAPRSASEPAATPPPQPPSPARAEPSSTQGAGWAVQIGSFANPDNARRLVEELRGQGHTAFISTSGSGANARHKVRIGPQASRTQADRLAARLKRQGRQVAVVSHP
jgi:DedD protein